MSERLGLIFPHQLFAQHPVLAHCDKVLLLEDSLFFGDKQYPAAFHKSKLVFHRASMRAYYDKLQEQGADVSYVAYDPSNTINDVLSRFDFDQLVAVDPTDYTLEKRLKQIDSNILLLETPLFINSRADNQTYLEDHKRLFMHTFYQWQRKRLDILMEHDGPTGGQWSFDHDNRKKLPKKRYGEVPPEPVRKESSYVQEAEDYVQQHFPNNPGSTDRFWYPIDHASAGTWLDTFLKERFANFGPYEDAITSQHHTLYHSLLSPLLNVGLLEPMEVVTKALEFAKQKNTPLQSVEGFVRQIIGWREYMRMTYEAKGVEMRNANTWQHTRKLSKHWYDGTTGIDPIDRTIHKILDTAYAHHIERLMVLGNAMFLCEVAPNDIYRWFMEMFIDAYDWVMVPNVYAMSQNSGSGIITTKPYISGSNYIRKMSDYPKGDWCDIWDALYWSFMIKHADILAKNHRMGFMVKRAQGFSDEQKEAYLDTRQRFFDSLEE